MENVDEVKFIKQFGVITNNQVIIKRGNKAPKKISITSISKLKLVKKRVLYSNCAILSFGILAMVTLILNLHAQLQYLLILSFISLSAIVYAFNHKFYFYSLIIKLNNEEQHIITTSQLQRRNIKDFYFAIFEKTRKNSVTTATSVN